MKILGFLFLACSLVQAQSVILTFTEGLNTSASNGNLPYRDAYTNCATSCISGVPQPPNSGGISHGELWCNSSQVTTCGTFGTGFVSSTITGTGVTNLNNGNGAGGTNSATSITATYGGTNGGACAVGTNIPSTIFSWLTLPGSIAAAQTVYGIATGATTYNTSSLEPTKLRVPTGDSIQYYVRETCQNVSDTTPAGLHLEWDTNYNDTNGNYWGAGMDFDFPTSKLRYCPQNCSSWKDIKLQRRSDGVIVTTLTWPAGDYIYTQVYGHKLPGCTFNSSSNCFFYDIFCFRDVTASGTLVCYNMQDATTGLTPGGIPVDKTSWTRNEMALQHQFDINGPNANVTNTVVFDNYVGFYLTSSVSKLGPTL